MEVVGLLPMKGHSERVPNKNTRTFAGQPLFYCILEKLANCEAVQRIIVNTDCDQIADMAIKKSRKVVVHIRPEELRGDFVSMNRIIQYDLQKCGADVCMQTHSTNPLVRGETIQAAIRRFSEVRGDGFDSLFSVTRYQTRLYDAQGHPVNHDPAELIRTQDLPPLFEENSCFYIFSKETFARNGFRHVGAKPYMFEIDKLEAIDIDTMDDFLIAETIYRTRAQK